MFLSSLTIKDSSNRTINLITIFESFSNINFNLIAWSGVYSIKIGEILADNLKNVRCKNLLKDFRIFRCLVKCMANHTNYYNHNV